MPAKRGKAADITVPTDFSDEDVEKINASMQKLMPGFKYQQETEILSNALSMRELLKTQGIEEFRKRLKDGGNLGMAVMLISCVKMLSLESYTQNFRPDPWFQVKCWAVARSWGQAHVLNFLGCQNSGKSEFQIWINRALEVLRGRDYYGFVAGPWKSASSGKIWTRVLGTQNDINEFFKKVNIKYQLWNKEDNCYSGSVKNLIQDQSKTEFISMDKAANARGEKRDTVLLQVDEYSENPSGLDIRRAIDNLFSNDNAFSILATNPDPDYVRHVKIKIFVDPTEKPVGEMKKDVDYSWVTHYGWAMRFCWANSPNNILGRNEYPYLFNEKRLARAKRANKESYSAQVEAWPFDGGANVLTDKATQRRNHVYLPDDRIELLKPEHRVYSLDAAFGGKDNCVATELSSGKFRLHLPDGSYVTQRKIKGESQIEIPDIKSQFTIDDDFMDKCQSIAAQTGWKNPFKVGGDISGAVQVSGVAIYDCMSRGIPLENFIIDTSQRADFGTAVREMLHDHMPIWSYEGTRSLALEEGSEWFHWPTKILENGEKLKWSGRCSRLISMMCFLTASFLQEGRIIGGYNIESGIDELASRPKTKRNSGKEDVLSKAELTRPLGQGGMGMPSPGYADSLVQGVYAMARYLDALDLTDDTSPEQHDGGQIEDWVIPNTRFVDRPWGGMSGPTMFLEDDGDAPVVKSTGLTDKQINELNAWI